MGIAKLYLKMKKKKKRLNCKLKKEVSHQELQSSDQTLQGLV